MPDIWAFLWMGAIILLLVWLAPEFVNYMDEKDDAPSEDEEPPKAS